MIYRLVFLFVVLPLLVQAQFPISPNARTESGLRTGQWTILYDSAFQGEVTEPDSAMYYRLARFENGIPSGKVRDFYRSGQKQWDGYIISADLKKMDGECRHYYQNGKVNIISHYSKGVLNGQYQEFWPKGELKTEGLFVNDSASGKWLYYYESGKKSNEIEWRKAKEQGISTSWYESGQLASKGMMIDGKREGIWERYFENGKLNWKSNYVLGEFHGFSEEYHDNGQLKEKGECKEGFYDGFWIHYHDNGQKEKEGKYIRGRKTGKWKEYTVEGVTEAEMEMVNGNKHGPYTEYYENGKIYCKGFYQDDHYAGEWTFFSEAGVIESQGKYYDTDSLEGTWTYYHPNGKIRASGLYERGYKSGKWIYYFDTGGLKSDEMLVQGKLQGELTLYHENGAVKEKRNYDQEVQHGLTITYYDNGQVKTQGTYDHEIKNGKWLSYYSDGNLDEQKNYLRDTLDGEFISNYKNGMTFESGTYTLGQKTGTWKKFYESGVLRKIEKIEKHKYAFTFYHPNGAKEFSSKGVVRNGYLWENAYRKEYRSNGELRVEGQMVDGLSQGMYIFYDSATGKKSSRGKFKDDKFDGEWEFYEKGKLKTRIYYVNGFRETVENVRDTVVTLINVKDYAAATQSIAWFKRVLKRDAAPNDIAWTSVYKLQGDIYYGQKLYAKALEEYLQYLETVKKIESDTTFRYRLALNALANAYSGIEEYPQALLMNEELLALSIEDTENYPIYTYNTALALYNVDREGEGETRLINLVNDYTSKYGPTHEHTFAAMNYLAQFQAEFLSKKTAAIRVYKQIARDIDPRNDLYLKAVRQIALRYSQLDSVTTSNEWLQKTIDYQVEYGLDKYKSYFEDVTMLAQQYFEMSQYEAASAVLVKGFNSIKKYNKRESMEFARLLIAACKMFTDANFDAKLSIEYAEMAKGILEKLGQQDSDLYETVLTELASAHTGDPVTQHKAEDYYRQMIQLSGRKYGTSSDNYYTSIMLLGNFYSGRFQLAKSDSTLRIISDVGQKFGATSYMKAYYE